MAMIAQHTTAAPGVAGILRRGFTAIGKGLIALAEANSRVRAVQRLNAMSDAELAARGVRREDVVRHVFSDSFYI